MELNLDYSRSQKFGINLKELHPETGEYKHKKIIEQVPDVHDLDNLLFNEVIGMIGGGKTKPLYITINLWKSGMEIQRRMHRNNDPQDI